MAWVTAVAASAWQCMAHQHLAAAAALDVVATATAASTTAAASATAAATGRDKSVLGLAQVDGQTPPRHKEKFASQSRLRNIIITVGTGFMDRSALGSKCNRMVVDTSAMK